MHRVFIAAALTLSLTAPAFAAGGCSPGPASKFKPKAALETHLKSLGFKVRRIKVESGCYEVYAMDKAGRKFNAAYNAETLKKVANAEAGEQ